MSRDLPRLAHSLVTRLLLLAAKCVRTNNLGRTTTNRETNKEAFRISLSRCPKAMIVALKCENAFARQTGAMIATIDGRGSFRPKVGPCWLRPKKSQKRMRPSTEMLLNTPWRLY
jgi:hypothetical protein